MHSFNQITFWYQNILMGQDVGTHVMEQPDVHVHDQDIPHASD